MNTVEQEIIKAALKLFSEKGYAATSIRDISKEVNMKSASLYHYMENKKDLLYFIMKNYMNQLIDSIKSILDKEFSDDPRKKLEHLIKTHVDNHGKEKLAALVVDTEYRSLEGRHKEEIRKMRIAYEQIWIDVLDEGRKAGVFKFTDSRISAYALISLCTGVAHWFREGKEYSLPQVAEQYAEIGLRSVTEIKS